ncbi:dienelactone hydrolase family protein [Pseudorhodoplanes sp.]|uniref:dienelactone hydrolase family protein n=1 Tax=Pseudorhodoplanes sp. TaxID=1934341 RepID=UPI002C2FA8ED|nr:dienelactone hydrolase family protein [Pseudorhodoplanes sp.]HWV40070.1 dienelactone hydrolase family protein [Pseudorhodoplanes sp.]
MGKHFSLTTTDNHTLAAYRADPSGKPKGAMIVAQEIFGVNNHIRNVCDRLAAAGYVAVAPALFDRFVRNFESGYSAEEVAHARSHLGKIDWDKMLLDVAAGIDEVKSVGPVGVIGFCMGGTIAFLAATRLSGVKAAVAYYGGQIVKFADEKAKCPVQMHFGEEDPHIPMSDVAIIKEKQPDAEVYTYAAGHGFYCDERGSFHDASAKLAWQRTLDFLGKHLK